MILWFLPHVCGLIVNIVNTRTWHKVEHSEHSVIYIIDFFGYTVLGLVLGGNWIAVLDLIHMTASWDVVGDAVMT